MFGGIYDDPVETSDYYNQDLLVANGGAFRDVFNGPKTYLAQKAAEARAKLNRMRGRGATPTWKFSSSTGGAKRAWGYSRGGARPAWGYNLGGAKHAVGLPYDSDSDDDDDEDVVYYPTGNGYYGGIINGRDYGGYGYGGIINGRDYGSGLRGGTFGYLPGYGYGYMYGGSIFKTLGNIVKNVGKTAAKTFIPAVKKVGKKVLPVAKDLGKNVLKGVVNSL